MKYKTTVHHWRYEDGWRDVPHILKDLYQGETRIFEECGQGWFCWVYAANDAEFVDWMRENMRGKYECDYRFNSGDPMHTVLIREDEDATLFKLRWM